MPKKRARPDSPKVSPASPAAALPSRPTKKSGKPSPESENSLGESREIEAKTDIPEELDSVWDEGIAEAFKALHPKRQNFILAYVKTWNAAESYRQSHNPLASDHVASANGSRLVANDSIGLILAKFANNKTEALFLVQKTYHEAAQLATKPIFGKDDLGQPILVMEQPDYAVRVKAAEAISKLHGLNQPAEVKHSGEIATTHRYDIPNKRPVGT